MGGSKIHRAPLLIAGVLAFVIGMSGGAGVYFAADRREAAVTRVEGLGDALAANTGLAENFLIVGSDTRANLDPDGNNDATAGCDCGDTLIILRRDPEHGASLLSLPRDLWLPLAGRGESGKITWSYGDGEDRLAQTITQGLGIPINHYIEVDFQAFTELVDAIGGVEICVDYATQDTNSGLDLQPGCSTLDGAMGLAYARSRHYTEFKDGQWVEDGLNDYGRVRRQQHFIEVATNAVLAELRNDPLQLGDLLEAAEGVVKFDEDLNVFDAAQALRGAAQQGLTTYELSTEERTIGDQAALVLNDDSEAILDYFRGTGPLPGSEGDAPVTTLATEETGAPNGT